MDLLPKERKMGLRIHKVIGYGLSDFDPDHDERLNPSQLLSAEDATFTVGELLEWGQEHIETLRELYPYDISIIHEAPTKMSLKLGLDLLSDENKEISGYDCIVFDREYGEPNVVLFIPVDNIEEWYRYDDIIDYTEETADIHELANHVKTLTTGIYPYNHVMVRFRDPPEGTYSNSYLSHIKSKHEEWADNKGLVRLPVSYYSWYIGHYASDVDPLVQGKLLEHLLNDWRPTVPVSIILMIHYLELSNDPVRLINNLRPMIYTYWS